MQANSTTVSPANRWPTPIQVIRELRSRRELIQQLVHREIFLRYRGAYLGLIWSFVNPLLMLAIYTFVFSFIFHAQWDGQEKVAHPKTYFALSLFAGLVPFTVFAEVMNRAPMLILSVPNYVKKVIFPLEVLPIVTLGSALFHSLVSTAILLAGMLLLHQMPTARLVLLPIAYIPLVCLCAGLAWILASVGTYIRDLGQGIVPTVQLLMFLTPVFYPISAVPESIQPWLKANPLTLIVGGFREAVLNQGQVIESLPWMIWTAISILLAWAGYGFFQKTRAGFADVV